jgi:hypothetical protein
MPYLLILLSFFAATCEIPVNQAIAAGRSPECEEWRGRLLELWDRSAITEMNPLPVKNGHSVSDLIPFLKNYPGDPPFPFRPGDLPKDPSPEKLESTVQKALDLKPCSPMLRYELQRGLLASKAVAKKIKLELVGNLLKGARDSATKEFSLIDSLLELNLLGVAQDQGILKLSDALYLELGSITLLTKKTHSQLMTENPVPECESSGKQKCSKDQMMAIYEGIRKELSESRWIGERLSWWAGRVKL